VLGLATFLAVGVVVPPARATVMVEIPIEDLAREAHAIVHGVVARVGTRLVARGGSLDPHTIVTLDVRVWLKGSGGRRVHLRELGGVTRTVGLAIAGVPRYQPGEEVVVFLEARDRFVRTLALSQGRFLVRRDRPDGRARVTRDLDGIGFARFDEKGLTIAESPRQGSLPLDELLRVVEAARRFGGRPGVHLGEATP